MQFNAHSPTDTTRTYTLGEETNGATAINSQYDKVVYAAPAQTVTVPHQTSAAGELYAVSTKAVNRKNKEEPLKEKPVKEQPPQGDNDDSKKLEGVSGNTYVQQLRIAYICDRICEKGSYTRIQCFDFKDV